MKLAAEKCRPTSARCAVACRRGRPHAKSSSGLRARAWWVIRKDRIFTLEKMLFSVADGSERDAPGNLQKYISALERVGVLARLERREPGAAATSNGHVVWRLVRDLGRKAPVWRAAQSVLFDPNSGALIATRATLAAAAAAAEAIASAAAHDAQHAQEAQP